MFVTSPAFELQVPRGLAQPGQRFWRSVGFSLNVPWFIVSVEYRDENEEACFCQDMLMSSDADVAEVLEGDVGDTVVGLQYVEPPSYSPTGGWRMRSVRKVWRAAKPSDLPSAPLVFEDEFGRFASGLDDVDLEHLVELVRELPLRHGGERP
jgi:hypothetical protein